MKKHKALLLILSLNIFVITSYTFSQNEFWELTNSPEGGRIERIVENSNGQLFIATYEGRVYRSDDHGSSWILKSDQLVGLYPYDMLVKSNNTILFSSDIFSSNPGLFRSVDNGVSWEKQKSFVEGQYHLAEGFQGRIFAYFATNDSFISDDDGKNWKEFKILGITNGNIAKIFKSSKGYLLLLTGDFDSLTVYKSTDNGNTWNKTNSTKDFNFFDGECSIINQLGEIFISTYDGIYKSTDEGLTWGKASNGLPTIPYIYDRIVADNDNIYVFSFYNRKIYKSSNDGNNWIEKGKISNSIHVAFMKLFMDSQKQLFVGADGPGIYKSTDEGVSWQKSNTGIKSSRVSCITSGMNGKIFCYFYELSLYQTTNKGLSWEKTTNYFDDFPLWKLAINSKGYVFAAAFQSYKGIFRSKDDGITWEQIGFDGKDVFALVIGKDDRIYVNIWGYGLYRSNDDGNSWDKITPGTIAWDATEIAVGENGLVFANFGNSGLSKSTDYGNSWVDINSPYKMSPMVLDNSSNLFILGNNLWKSSDLGNSFQKINLPLLKSSSDDRSGILYVKNQLFIGSRQSQLFRSFDSGQNWSEVKTQFVPPIQLIYGHALDNDGFLYLGSNGMGVIKSKYSLTASPSKVNLQQPLHNSLEVPIKPTLTWEQPTIAELFHLQVSLKENFSSFVVNDSILTNTSFTLNNLQLNAKYYWRVRAKGNGLWGEWSATWNFRTIVTDVDDQEKIPTTYSLSQNYPNPFNPVTTISYGLPKSSNVQLVVYNLLGQKVAVLVNSFRQAGYYKVDFNSANLPSGVYVYRLQTGEYSSSKKMIYLK